MKLMLDNLILLSKGELKNLSKKCNCTLEKIKALLKIIRSMNPKPGEVFEHYIQPISAPDLIVRKIDGSWTVDSIDQPYLQ